MASRKSVTVQLFAPLDEALGRMAEELDVERDDLLNQALQTFLKNAGYVKVVATQVPPLEDLTDARPTAPEGSVPPRVEVKSAPVPPPALSPPQMTIEAKAFAPPDAGERLEAALSSHASRPQHEADPSEALASTNPSVKVTPEPSSAEVREAEWKLGPPVPSAPDLAAVNGREDVLGVAAPAKVSLAADEEAGTQRDLSKEAAAAIALEQGAPAEVADTAPRGTAAVARDVEPLNEKLEPLPNAKPEVLPAAVEPAVEKPALKPPVDLEPLRATAQKRIDDISAEVERWVKPRVKPAGDAAFVEEAKPVAAAAKAPPEPAPPAPAPEPPPAKRGPVPEAAEEDDLAPTAQRDAVPPSSLKPAKEVTGKKPIPQPPVSKSSSELNALKTKKQPSRDYDLPTRLKPEAEVARAGDVEPADRTFIVSNDGPVTVFIVYKTDNPKLVDTERFLIGRGDKCDMVINSVRVSREHVAVLREGNDVFIEDLKSSNGTWFANKRVSKQKVSDGDEFLLGNEPVKFMLKKGFPGVPR